MLMMMVHDDDDYDDADGANYYYVADYGDDGAADDDADAAGSFGVDVDDNDVHLNAAQGGTGAHALVVKTPSK